jgi:hypothetical protein
MHRYQKSKTISHFALIKNLLQGHDGTQKRLPKKKKFSAKSDVCSGEKKQAEKKASPQQALGSGNANSKT